MERIWAVDLGRAAYRPTWELQERLHALLWEYQQRREPPPYHFFLAVEHPHVYTLGKSGHIHNLLVDEAQLTRQGIDFCRTNRGGDITYHGPGQLVGYPIFDLTRWKRDVRWYMRMLEQVIIDTVAEWGITAGRIEGMTGVWVDADRPHRARKICAMGVRISRWITMHGFALNVNTDLRYFQMIIPCGIANKEVTSMERELGRKVPMEQVRRRVADHLARRFGARVEWHADLPDGVRAAGAPTGPSAD